MFWNTTQSPLKLICDIGSATVALAVVDTSKKTPEIIFTTKVPMVIQEIFDQTKLEQALLSFFTDATKKISDAFANELAYVPVKQIQSCSFIFSSPWYATKISTVVIQKDAPFLLDERGVLDIVEQEEKKFENEALQGDYASVGSRDMHVIERDLVRVKLNGYETASPYLKKVKNAELSIAMSIVPHELLLKLVEIIKNTLHITQSKSYTFPLVSFAAIHTLFPHDTDFLLVDIAGETTDITYIEDNIIVGSHSFTLARNSLVRTVGEKLSLQPDMAISYLSLFAKGSLEEEIAKKIENIVDQYFARFNEVFLRAQVVTRAKEKGVIRMFFTAHDDIAEIFLKQFAKSELQRFDVLHINDQVLDSAILYEKHVSHDPFLSLEAIFLANTA